ncbi:hypothetical protein OCL06_16015 [Alteromonas sp. ASW11-19]|uniref:DUF6884 domain-containing protein n=1 Tax=Alteromonas salexigens TaxID=2982530 RepID=A0ABT2VS25_9ALTE|nr:DUF6884 domain-containing protein [Alteromonas salexigens]MCU7556098.1 hypothetical protein [Alteromonas salexigens]
MNAHIPLIIIPCTAAKQSSPCKAIDLYQGTGYRSVVLASSTRRGIDYNLAFLSAKYGLVMADTVIAPYEQKLTRKALESYAPSHQQAFNQLLASTQPTEIIACLPKLYRQALTNLLSEAKYAPPVHLPDEGSGIGAQRGFLKSHLDRLKENALPVWCFFDQTDSKEPLQARVKVQVGDRFRPWVSGNPKDDDAVYASVRRVVRVEHLRSGGKVFDQYGEAWSSSAIWFGLDEAEKAIIRQVAKTVRFTESNSEIECYLSDIRQMMAEAA